MKIKCDNPEAVVQEAFWLAWRACGIPTGMGWLQDNPTATKEQVLANVSQQGDYPRGNEATSQRPGSLYGDYVFGRMMKLCLLWDGDSVTVPDSPPRLDYQGWCSVYKTYAALIHTAVDSLGRVKV